MRRGYRRNNKCFIIALAFGGALICLTFLSVEILLIVLAVVLIIIGIWLLLC